MLRIFLLQMAGASRDTDTWRDIHRPQKAKILSFGKISPRISSWNSIPRTLLHASPKLGPTLLFIRRSESFAELIKGALTSSPSRFAARWLRIIGCCHWFETRPVHLFLVVLCSVVFCLWQNQTNEKRIIRSRCFIQVRLKEREKGSPTF